MAPAAAAKQNRAKLRQTEQASFDAKIDQPSTVSDDVGQSVDIEKAFRPPIAIQRDLDEEYAKQLEFNEGYQTIRINRGQEKHAALSVPCKVNGHLPEAIVDGKPVMLQEVPVDIPVTLKRKYIEDIVSKRQMIIGHHHDNPLLSQRVKNHITKQIVPVYNVVLLGHNHPLEVQEWWERITSTQM